MREVFIVGVGMTKFGRHMDKSHNDLTQDAVRQALSDANAAAKDIQLAIYGNVTQGAMVNEQVVRGQFALRPLGIQGIPIFNVENACASSSTAMQLAQMHVANGQCDVALAVGTEKLYTEDRQKRFAVFSQTPDIVEASNLMQKYSASMEPLPASAKTDDDHSVLMDCYAGQARLHMKKFGTTQRQFAAVAAKNHQHSAHNPLAAYQNSMTTDEVLAGRLISWPLTVTMCAPICDGSAAVIVCSKEGLKRLGGSRAVRILACVMQGGADRDALDYEQHASRLAALSAYEKAGVGPQDLSVVEVHDASAVGEIIETEALGLCAIGEGGPLAESGATTLGGRVPVNTSGGLESRGHPLGATGLAQIHELVTQLRGEAGSRQVKGARIGMAQNGGGFIGVEEAVVCITLLGRS